MSTLPKHWHALPAAEVAAMLATNPETGLSTQEAEKRLAEAGPNRLPEAPPPSLLSRILAQLADVSILTLLAAALISAATAYFLDEPGSFLERFGDPIAISAIVLLNILLSLGQESRATRALAALKEMTAPSARVRRDGKELTIPARDLVPGDLVLLGEGDAIPADLRLVSSFDLSAGESALTGESAPVEKHSETKLSAETPLAERSTACYLGTSILRGKGAGLVVSTGPRTELGHIAGMLAAVESPETPLQKNLQRFGKGIVAVCLASCAFVFGMGALLNVAPLPTLFLVAVSLAVAAIPEGLPAVTTIALALGTQRMARRNALVRRLPAVETLGSVQVICTDKTGTLTTNQMTARRLFAAGQEWNISLDKRGGFEPSQAPPSVTLRAAASTRGASLEVRDNGEHTLSGDPTDAALLLLAHKGGVRADALPVVGERPFSSERRMSTTLVESSEGMRTAYNRGAVEPVLERSSHLLGKQGVTPLNEEGRASLAEVQARWAQDGMRVIALSHRDSPSEEAHWEEGLTFVGLVGIVDPPRPEVIPAIREAQSAGIRVVMITGDHPDTARAIARELGMWSDGDAVFSGAELDAFDDAALDAVLPRLRVVARAAPIHKLRVIQAFARQGITAAMTGDGVNDAPAIKAAPIGIAMGKAGTDVTKEAADLVLADDNFATIIAAVEEGRAIYANIRKFIFFMLSSNAGLVLAITGAALLGWPLLLTPIQLLWINLITNGLPALALGVDPADPSQMKRPPRSPEAPFLQRAEYFHIGLIGTMFALLGLVAFLIGVADHEIALHGGEFFATLGHAVSNLGALPAESIESGQSLAFTVLALGPIFHSFNCRSESRSLFGMKLFENKSLWVAAFAAVLLQAAALYLPLLRPLFRAPSPSTNEFLFVAVLCVFPLVAVELGKLWLRHHFDPTATRA